MKDQTTARSAEPTIRKVEGGFPHSEIPGSKLVRSSPRLIAAYHVLHRLSAPRHPPNALKALDRSRDRCPQVSDSSFCWRSPRHGHKKTGDTPLSGRRHLMLAEHDRASRLSPRPTATFPLHDVDFASSVFFRPTLCKLDLSSGWYSRPGQRHSLPPSREARQAAPYGGDRRDRTDDLMLAKHALSQLSYVPNCQKPPLSQQKPPTNAERSQGRPAARAHARNSLRRRTSPPASEASLTMVGLGRLERPTSPLSGVRSNHLSYRP